MSKPRTYQTEAIIIKKIKLGEADRILTLYTPHLGKIRGVAKGVRRPRSKLAGHLELLTHSLVTLARGKNIDTIIGSQTINSFLTIKSDLKLTSYALYAAELTDQFTADNTEDEPLFQLLLETLQQMCQEGNLDLLLRYFELHLLSEAGYRPQLNQCVSCHTALQPTANYFSASAGGVLCSSCRRSQLFTQPLSVSALKVLRLLQSGDYATARRIKIDSALSRELEEIVRGYIRYLLERDLKSAHWLDTLREKNRETILRKE